MLLTPISSLCSQEKLYLNCAWSKSFLKITHQLWYTLRHVCFPPECTLQLCNLDTDFVAYPATLYSVRQPLLRLELSVNSPIQWSRRYHPAPLHIMSILTTSHHFPQDNQPRDSNCWVCCEAGLTSFHLHYSLYGCFAHRKATIYQSRIHISPYAQWNHFLVPLISAALSRRPDKDVFRE